MDTADKHATLRDHLETLPQELYDEVFSIVVSHLASFDPGIVTIDSNYRPPEEIGLSHDVRKAVARNYYSKMTLVGHVDDLNLWLASLDEEHRASIAIISCWTEEDGLAPSVRDIREVGQKLRELVGETGASKRNVNITDSDSAYQYFMGRDGWERVSKGPASP